MLATKFKRNVEVDESLFTHGRFLIDESKIRNATRTDKQIWVFGMVERSTKSAKIFIVPDRTTETLWPLINENVAYRSTVHSDGYRSYQGMPWRQRQEGSLRHQRWVHPL
jgi:hypothetical protein